MNNIITEIYSRRLEKFTTQHDKLLKQNRLISWSRLALFLVTSVLIVIFWSSGMLSLFLIVLLSIVPFLILIKLNVKFGSRLKILSELIKINRNELEAIKGNFSVFPAGNDFVNPNHPYSYDLDIFGNESVYQMLNRTCTAGGAHLLANALGEPMAEVQQIIERQNAVKELAGMLDWRQNFNATGNAVLEIAGETENKLITSTSSGSFRADTGFNSEIQNWLCESYQFINQKLLKYILIISPVISTLFLSLTILNFLPFMALVLWGFVQLAFVGYYVKKINKIHAQIGRKVDILDKYESLLIMIENEDLKSSHLKNEKSALNVDNQIASARLNQLKKLSRYLDNRMNILFAFFGNALFLWDLQIVFKLEKWRNINKEKLNKWFSVIYQFDFISSLAGYASNHSHYCFPEVIAGDFYLEMEQAGHPLIHEDSRIDNNFRMNGYGRLMVITGANMAGKSTFLRTVGVNIVLALTGSVVCAKKFTISTVHLHTSVRTSDSVQKSESYFFAELKRLKSIIDRLQSGEKLFIIIDEMLRGTNSKDKHMGSEALIEKLIRLDTSGLIATHDIALGSLENRFPENVNNYRFEVEIKNNELEFDYKLKTGISQNLNATFLMKKMGITD